MRIIVADWHLHILIEFHLSSFPPAIMQLKFLSQFRFSIRNCLPPLLALALFISFISISIRFVQVFRFV